MPTLLLSFPERQQPPVHRTFDYGPLVGLPRFVRFALCGEIPAISAIRCSDLPMNPITQCPANAFFAFAGVEVPSPAILNLSGMVL